jgi:hypothetical protein
MNPEKAVMCSRDGSHLSHLREILRTVDMLEALQELRKRRSRWREMPTDDDFPLP